MYILILPGMGIVSEMLPVFSRKPLFGYSVVVFSGIAIGFLGWGVWAHHMFATGLGPVAISAFGLSTMLIAIPTGVKIFNWLGTVWRARCGSRPRCSSRSASSRCSPSAGSRACCTRSSPADTQQTDTYFVVAHFHYVLFGGLMFGAVLRLLLLVAEGRSAACSTSVSARSTSGRCSIGFNLTFFPMHFVGLSGMPRRTYRYDTGMGWDALNSSRRSGRSSSRSRCSSSS